jgi:hypothetical protein
MDKDMQPKMSIDQVGDTVWLLNDQYHREDGPAIEHADGGTVWLLNDQYHREDGPAIEFAEGDARWYLHGKRLSFEEWLDQNKTLIDEEKVMLKLQYG